MDNILLEFFIEHKHKFLKRTKETEHFSFLESHSIGIPELNKKLNEIGILKIVIRTWDDLEVDFEITMLDGSKMELHGTTIGISRMLEFNLIFNGDDEDE